VDRDVPAVIMNIFCCKITELKKNGVLFGGLFFFEFMFGVFIYDCLKLRSVRLSDRAIKGGDQLGVVLGNGSSR